MAGTVWDEALGAGHAIVVRTDIERWPRKGQAPEKVLIIVVEPDGESRDRCPGCGVRGKPAEYGVVRWRTLDVHGKQAFLESRLPGIICGQHAKITAAVPWARRDSRFSRPSGLRRVGIDEKSRGKGSDRFLVIVTNHDTGRVAWIGGRRCQATAEAFSRPPGRSGPGC